MDTIQDKAESLEDKSEGKTQDFASDLSNRMSMFGTRLEALARSAREEAKEEWAELKEESGEAIQKLKKKSAEISEEAKEEWQEFRQEARSFLKRMRDKIK
jgi:ElaB/YqjD/DUF883 family membrane-anchored ribosome-binding protein